MMHEIRPDLLSALPEGTLEKIDWWERLNEYMQGTAERLAALDETWHKLGLTFQGVNEQLRKQLLEGTWEQ